LLAYLLTYFLISRYWQLYRLFATRSPLTSVSVCANRPGRLLCFETGDGRRQKMRFTTNRRYGAYVGQRLVLS